VYCHNSIALNLALIAGPWAWLRKQLSNENNNMMTRLIKTRTYTYPRLLMSQNKNGPFLINHLQNINTFKFHTQLLKQNIVTPCPHFVKHLRVEDVPCCLPKMEAMAWCRGGHDCQAASERACPPVLSPCIKIGSTIDKEHCQMFRQKRSTQNP
jgi:hypothetical protein